LVRKLKADRKDRSALLIDLATARHKVLQCMLAETHIKSLKERMMSVAREYRTSSADDVQREIAEIFIDPMLSSSSADLSFEAGSAFLLAHAARSRLQGNRAEKVKYLELLVQHWEANPRMIQLRPAAYHRMIVNLLNGYYHASYKQKFNVEFVKAQNICMKDKVDASAALVSRVSAKLLFLMNNRLMDKALLLESMLVKSVGPQSMKADAQSTLNLMFNIGSMYFLTDNLKEASKWYYRIIAFKQKVRVDLQGMSRVMILLSEYDRNKSELLLANIRSNQRYYGHHAAIRTIEDVVFNCIQQMLRNTKSEESRYLFEAHAALTVMNVRHGDVIGGEPVMCWMESKLQSTSVRQVFEESGPKV
jgi:hypothetical protein